MSARATSPAGHRTRSGGPCAPAYQADLAKGLDRFFEPRRTTCPWCGSGPARAPPADARTCSSTSPARSPSTAAGTAARLPEPAPDR